MNNYWKDGLRQTMPCGGAEKHPEGLVGKLWRINNPDSIATGHGFLRGRLKANDLFLCTRHSGDGFQIYIFVEELTDQLIGKVKWDIGAYGFGDASCIDINKDAFTALSAGGTVSTNSAFNKKLFCPSKQGKIDQVFLLLDYARHQLSYDLIDEVFDAHLKILCEKLMKLKLLPEDDL